MNEFRFFSRIKSTIIRLLFLGTFYGTNLEIVLRVGFAEGLPVILDPGVLGQHALHALGRGFKVTLS